MADGAKTVGDLPFLGIFHELILADAEARGQITRLTEKEKPDCFKHIEPLYRAPGGYATTTRRGDGSSIEVRL